MGAAGAKAFYMLSLVALLLLSPAAACNTAYVRQLAVGEQMSCAQLSNGALECWGPDGSSNSNPTVVPAVLGGPLDLTKPSSIKSVAVGRRHACALLKPPGSTAKVACFGDNSKGQLKWDGSNSQPTTITQAISVAFDGFDDFDIIGIAAAADYSCAIITQPQVGAQTQCWGDAPDPAFPGSDAVQLAAGPDRLCIRFARNEVWCAGRGEQLGKVGLPPATKVVSIAAGGHHFCAITNENGSSGIMEGSVWCWGQQNNEGQVGTPDSSVTGPYRAYAGRLKYQGETTGSPAISVTAGDQHTCIMMEGGDVKCWGLNADCQNGAGRGNNVPMTLPLPAGAAFDASLAAVVSAPGVDATCMVTGPAQPPRCWGKTYTFTSAGAGSLCADSATQLVPSTCDDSDPGSGEGPGSAAPPPPLSTLPPPAQIPDPNTNLPPPPPTTSPAPTTGNNQPPPPPLSPPTPGSADGTSTPPPPPPPPPTPGTTTPTETQPPAPAPGSVDAAAPPPGSEATQPPPPGGEGSNDGDSSTGGAAPPPLLPGQPGSGGDAIVDPSSTPAGLAQAGGGGGSSKTKSIAGGVGGGFGALFLLTLVLVLAWWAYARRKHSIQAPLLLSQQPSADAAELGAAGGAFAAGAGYSSPAGGAFAAGAGYSSPPPLLAASSSVIVAGSTSSRYAGSLADSAAGPSALSRMPSTASLLPASNTASPS